MSAVMSRPLADYTATDLRSIDELDKAIGHLVRQMNAECYQMLVLVREFDDRFGWKPYGARAALAAGDLGGVCRRAAVVQQGCGR